MTINAGLMSSDETAVLTCPECGEAYCDEHIGMDGLCPDCSADWEDEGDW